MAKRTGPACGNNPNYPLTDGDRKAVDDFKARLALQAAAKPHIDSAAWVDGDPLMEVIAVTLWKHCARDDEDMPQMVRDDPRTIAAFAAAVARAHAAAVPPPADRATVLTEATNRLTAAIQSCPTMSGQCLSCEAKAAAIRELRRIADEAQQLPAAADTSERPQS